MTSSHLLPRYMLDYLHFPAKNVIYILAPPLPLWSSSSALRRGCLLGCGLSKVPGKSKLTVLIVQCLFVDLVSYLAFYRQFPHRLHSLCSLKINRSDFARRTETSQAGQSWNQVCRGRCSRRLGHRGQELASGSGDAGSHRAGGGGGTSVWVISSADPNLGVHLWAPTAFQVTLICYYSSDNYTERGRDYL